MNPPVVTDPLAPTVPPTPGAMTGAAVPARTGRPGRDAAGPPRRRAVVIGAGFGGLSVAIRLLADDWDVTVLERRATIGGRASRIRDRGFTWDTGPSLITMPWLFDELFRVAGSSLAAEARLHELEPMYRIHWTGEDRHFDFLRSVPRAPRRDREVRRPRRGEPRPVPRGDEGDPRAGHPPVRPRPVHARGRLRQARARRWSRLDAVRFLGSFVAQLLRRAARPAGLRLPLALHRRRPVPRAGDLRRARRTSRWPTASGTPKAGVYSLVEAMARAVERGGGRIVTGDGVARIAPRPGRARAVVTDRGERDPRRPRRVRRRRDRPGRAPSRRAATGLPWRLRPLRTTMSAYLLYLGTDRPVPRLLHHTLVVGDDYRGFIREVTHERQAPDVVQRLRPRADPDGARDGARGRRRAHRPAPGPEPRSGDDWTRVEPALRDRLLDWLEGPARAPGPPVVDRGGARVDAR